MLLVARACLLWALVGLHFLGGAALFRRFFPRESPWLGFVVPALSLVLALNFIEHGIALPVLRWALPVTALGAIWLLADRRANWRLLRGPSAIFLTAFGITLLLRFLHPDILFVRDAVLDLHLIANYLMGDTLPATSTWLPPVKLTNYYAFHHYGSSVLIRLLGLDIGTGYNISAALVAALILFLTAAIAWRLSGQRIGIAALMAFLTLCATTGSTAYLYLAIHELNPEDTVNLFNRMDDTDVHIGLWKWLAPVSLYNRRELFVPGAWSWLGVFHSTSVGQLLTLLSTYALVEIFHPRRTNFPWIVIASVPLLMLVCASWGVPLVGLIFLAGVAWAWWTGRRPDDLRTVLLGVCTVVICLTPMLTYFLDLPMPSHGFTQGEEHTQVTEFIIQWWPVYLPWIALFFFWPRLSPAVRIIQLLLPIGLVAVEIYTFGARFDMTGKSWGYLYSAAWATFLPPLLIRRTPACLVLSGLIIASSLVSLCFWMDFTNRTVWTDDIGQLEGKGGLRLERKKAKLLYTLTPLHHQIILTGKSGWAGCNSPLLANFTGNYEYVTWSFDCDIDVYRDTFGEAFRREKEVNAIYDGQSSDPLGYLRTRNIAALVIWPDDNISDDIIARLKQQLAPSYVYVDARGSDTPDPPNAGVFLHQPPPTP